MRSFNPNPAAEALHQTRLRRGLVGRLPVGIAPESEVEGTATQRALADIVGAANPPGFKIGATGKRMQEYLGLTGPAAGFVAEGGLLTTGAVLEFRDYVRPGVECELAVRLAKGPTRAIGLTKQMMYRSATMGLEQALDFEAHLVEEAVRSQDYKEGLRAFNEKRPPEYKGY